MDNAANERLHSFDNKKPTRKAASLRKRWKQLKSRNLKQSAHSLPVPAHEGKQTDYRRLNTRNSPVGCQRYVLVHRPTRIAEAPPKSTKRFCRRLELNQLPEDQASRFSFKLRRRK
ncbi:hypothetical protein PC123_g12367 [Phytophthora cactorum]|nr:hypothetical protein PC123_g12367 [Phytophthora cactorum]